MLESKGERAQRLFLELILVLVAFAMVLPVWHVLMQSVSAPLRSYENGFFFAPRGFSLSAYRVVLADPLIGSAYKNTLIVTVGGTFLNIAMSVCAAYPLSRKDLLGRSAVSYMIFFTMLFGGGLIPTYLVVNGLKLTNTLWALVIPNAVSAYNTFVLRNFISTLPDSLEEAARIDGANDLVLVSRIVLPLCVPALAVLCVFYGVGHWNSWFNCVIYINSAKKYTLQPILRQIIMVEDTTAHFAQSDMLEQSSTYSVRMATVAVATLPILCVYPFLQRYFVKGVMVGAVKG